MYIAWAAAAVVALFVVLRFRKIWGSLLFSAFTGIGGLLLVTLTSTITGINLVPNTFNIIVSAVCGLPGVAGLLFMNLIWQV